MRKAFLTCCLAWWLTVLQGLSLQAFAAYNPALIDTSNTVAQIDGTSPARTLMHPILIPVPELVGMSLNDARAALLEANLRVGQVTSAESGGEPGSVLEQSPEAGARVRPGSPVALAISARRMVDVPSVVGLELAEARDILERAGLVPFTVAANGQSDEALVVSQSPEPSETATEGTPVMLTLETVASANKKQRPDKTPWPAIATGAALIALLGGAILYRRSIRAKTAPAGREARVSIRETIDYGTQQVQLTGTPEKAPKIVITIRPDNGMQEIHPS